VDQTGVGSLAKILNDLGMILSPSVALTVKVYVVCEEIFGSVPEITPVAEFKVTPDGRDDPDASAYVTVESESVAVADKDTETNSSNVPRDPLAVCHTGDALTYNAFGRRPKRFDGFVTLML
jgi:hypothetical protein